MDEIRKRWPHFATEDIWKSYTMNGKSWEISPSSPWSGTMGEPIKAGIVGSGSEI